MCKANTKITYYFIIRKNKAIFVLEKMVKNYSFLIKIRCKYFILESIFNQRVKGKIDILLAISKDIKREKI